MNVTVVDYGIGNLFSVQRAFERCGATVTLASDADAIGAAERLVLPGVGAFADGMRGLRERGLVDPLRRYAAGGRPLLGICLGMQMLGSVSEEFGEHEGLGIIPGRVVRLPAAGVGGATHRIPHIAWSELRRVADDAWGDSPLAETPEGTPVYLVHSYHLVPDAPGARIAHCVYDGHEVSASIGVGRVFGCQFHPEKSGEAGLRILSAFLRI